MSYQKVPETITCVCDGCGYSDSVKNEGQSPTGWGKFTFTKVGRDHAGHAVGGHKYDLDLCESCSLDAHKHIRGDVK
jgi:hypothetical protein